MEKEIFTLSRVPLLWFSLWNSTQMCTKLNEDSARARVSCSKHGPVLTVCEYFFPHFIHLYPPPVSNAFWDICAIYMQKHINSRFILMDVSKVLTHYLPPTLPSFDWQVSISDWANGWWKGAEPTCRQETSLENSQWMGGAVRPRKSEGVKTSSNKTMHTLIQYTCTRTVYGYIIMRLHVYTTSNYNNC